MKKILVFLLIGTLSLSFVSDEQIIDSIRENYYSLKDDWNNLLVYKTNSTDYNVSVYATNTDLSESNHYCIIIKEDGIDYEFFIKNNFLYFVFSNENGLENRYYFNNKGRIIRWLDSNKEEVINNLNLETDRIFNKLSYYHSKSEITKKFISKIKFISKEIELKPKQEVKAEISEKEEKEENKYNFKWWYFAIGLFVLFVLYHIIHGMIYGDEVENKESEEESNISSEENLSQKNNSIQTYEEDIKLSKEFIKEHLTEDEEVRSVIFGSVLDNIFTPGFIIATNYQVFYCELDLPINAKKRKGKQFKMFKLLPFEFNSIKGFSSHISPMTDIKLITQDDEIYGVQFSSDEAVPSAEAKKMVRFVNQSMK